MCVVIFKYLLEWMTVAAVIVLNRLKKLTTVVPGKTILLVSRYEYRINKTADGVFFLVFE